MRLINSNVFKEKLDYLNYELYNSHPVGELSEEEKDTVSWFIHHISKMVDNMPTEDAIPVWYIIKWYEKRYKLGSTVADDWERGLLKEKIAKMYDDFENEKYLDNKQESERFAQMVKEVIELYNDWERENESNI